MAESYAPWDVIARVKPRDLFVVYAHDMLSVQAHLYFRGIATMSDIEINCRPTRSHLAVFEPLAHEIVDA